MNAAIAVHVHGPTPPPDSAAAFAGYQGKATALVGQLKPITL
ncbi:hypothetical protein [Pseudomonas sp. CCI1.2]|nr:hypothetical protein [Pseudomonas sp. CCI1.2]